MERWIEEYLESGNRKILFMWGPRRSGKTTVLEKFSKKLEVPVFDFDLVSDREKFVPDERVLGRLVAEHKVILIDEVQAWPEGTVALKILFDRFDVKIVATGSSELRQKSAKSFDSLAGRFEEIFCLPVAVEEMLDNESPREYELPMWQRDLAEKMQVYGGYPEVCDSVLSESEKIGVLENLLDTYVIKDVVNIYELKNAKLARDILTKLALQLGSEVSMREIASSLSANVATVANYIEIFVKNYILISLPAFKTNLRRAVSENRKLYFFDLGIRNALVRDFRPTSLRPDRGGVWENFVISEMEKKRRNLKLKLSAYFYREYGGREVDLVLEDYQKNYVCWEMKSGEGENVEGVFPLSHRLEVVTPGSYLEELKLVDGQGDDDGGGGGAQGKRDGVTGLNI